MRLHELQVAAFGPFADHVTIDFDDLSASGLFLLSGPTGAGKTSVLDAVSFALYGQVPGDRQSAKRLRSDQAADGVAPRVTLEVTLAGRRFRITRSAAWERPKKRGHGTTTEQAAVRISERRGGEWTQLSNRLDETGHLVSELVGMSFTQFCQVALLPQGRFQAFLRAGSDERHRLLQQLFRTQRFEDIERWLRERRKSLRQGSLRHQEAVAALLSRISETAGMPLPADWDLHDLVAPAADGSLATWSRELRVRSAEASGSAGARAADAAAERDGARSVLEAALALAERQRAHREATAAHERLQADAEAHARRRRQLAAARRAAAVAPFHEMAAQQQSAAAQAAAEEVRYARRLARLLDVGTPPDDLDEVERRSLELGARARALLPRERDAHSMRERLDAGRRRQVELEASTVTMAEALAGLPDAITERRSRVGAAAAARDELPRTRERAAALRRQLAAAERVLALEVTRADAREHLLGAREELHQHKEAWLHLQEARLHGMAAELAGALAMGADCPVCGSHDHPRPAARRPDAPDGAAEKAARRRVDDAESLRLVHEERVRELTTQLAVARDQATGADDAADQLREIESSVAELTVVAASFAAASAELAALEEQCQSLTTTREAALVQLAALRGELAALEEQVHTVTDELETVLAEGRAGSLVELVAACDRLVEGCRELGASRAEHQRTRASADRASTRRDRAAHEAGFPDAGAALAAALDAAQLEDLAARVAEHDSVLADVTTRLADPGLCAARALPAPDLDDCGRRLRLAEGELEEAQTRAAVAHSRSDRLADLDAALAAALADWAPARAELELAGRVSGLAEGTSPDNRLRMRLSAYVLAWRLTQVVAAANERLGRMSDHRYSLEHTGRRGAGETRGGLSLLVRDDWSGECRDPATLSGGETFVVSLALALGLADVIAHEVGGAELDTLFVDEGFGSLDADTLDDVMGTLDALREGGRVVGVVSHVAEMRDRIPTQLRVVKSRRGSSVAIVR